MANSTRHFVLANDTLEGIAGMVQAPTDRAAALKKSCKAVGVKFISLDLCRGAYDVVVIAESDRCDRVLGPKMAVAASGTASEVPILAAMDPTAALEHAGAAAKVYTPAGQACRAGSRGLASLRCRFSLLCRERVLHKAVASATLNSHWRGALESEVQHPPA